jgi:glycosyltransferase involved in cell wall biosynthesis
MTAATDKPLVSMIVVCYNQDRWVLETLESVRAQTYKHTELIIVDDCSTDDSVAIIDRWLQETGIPCNFIRHEKNMGVCRTVNDAVRAATGKYISMIASDDLWLPDKIERQVEIMEAQPEDVAVAYSKAFWIDADGRQLPGLCSGADWEPPRMPEGQILDALLRGWFVLPQTTLIRRSCYDKVGLYDEDLPFEDRDMFMRIARHYSFIYFPLPTAKYRIHPKSICRSDPDRHLRDLVLVCFKQFRLGDLTEGQKSILAATALDWIVQLYGRNDRQAPSLLSALSRVTGRKDLWWRCSLARFRVRLLNFREWSHRDKIVWRIRNHLWHPVLNRTRAIRHTLGLNRGNLRSLLKRLT